MFLLVQRMIPDLDLNKDHETSFTLFQINLLLCTEEVAGTKYDKKKNLISMSFNTPLLKQA